MRAQLNDNTIEVMSMPFKLTSQTEVPMIVDYLRLGGDDDERN